MSTMIKALARQFPGVRQPVTMLLVALWAGAFATFVALGLSR